ncbi:MAG: hypothetical protein LBE76_07050 [Nitrososphaerota archaeon]|jgi:hypothetical protein|nr:hypothetical protein [Nitrososphaerota archaeon]
MKKIWGLLLAFLLLIVVFLPATSIHLMKSTKDDVDELYFGVTFDGQSAEEFMPIIDKVKNYTNLFVITSWSIATNQTALYMVCDYIADANLYFIVFFAFISQKTYPWHQQWLHDAVNEQRWGDKFIGIYLNDEHGGKQIDAKEAFTYAKDYDDAAKQFVQTVKYGLTGQSTSMIDLKNKDIKLFTSDYVLQWWVYLSDYDVVFTELGWNITASRQIALGRGAATMQNKDWGTIITWETTTPPYLGNNEQIYRYMIESYRAGAKYITLFNYPTYPENNPYGMLSDEHFEVIRQFWQYTKTYPRSSYGTIKVDTALVLPQNYGWGMRRSNHIINDPIWGLWPEDEKAPLILEKVEFMETRYNLQFDIIYEDPQTNPTEKYTNIIYWNTTTLINNTQKR